MSAAKALAYALCDKLESKKLMKSYEILFLAAGILGKWPGKLRPLIMKCLL